jgi:hypothetical protein
MLGVEHNLPRANTANRPHQRVVSLVIPATKNLYGAETERPPPYRF